MKRVINILAALFVILMIIGLVMNNDAGIIVASTGAVCGIVGYVIGRFLQYKKMLGD